MHIRKNVALSRHSTMRLGGTADYLVRIRSRRELVAAVRWAERRRLDIRMIGSGSNIIWRDEGFRGLVIVNGLRGFRRVREDQAGATYRLGAGEYWDKTVERTVKAGLRGLECLSLIPGTVGATPVQNVGAYGQDISQRLVELEAYDRSKHVWVALSNAECRFGYRTSRFKTTDNGRFLIASITVSLDKTPPMPPFYDSLQAYFDQANIPHPTLTQIRRAVIAIRQSKLPDPAKVANNGSFFANPIVSERIYQRIKAAEPNVKAWPIGSGKHKLSAAWLVETAGFKGVHDPETGMSTWKNQALVLVNEHARSTQDLLDYQAKITKTVFRRFGVKLVREPELLP